jgi:hypothetical protein
MKVVQATRDSLCSPERWTGSAPAAGPPEPTQELEHGPEQQEPHHGSRQPLEGRPRPQQPHQHGSPHHGQGTTAAQGSRQMAQQGRNGGEETAQRTHGPSKHGAWSECHQLIPDLGPPPLPAAGLVPGHGRRSPGGPRPVGEASRPDTGSVHQPAAAGVALVAGSPEATGGGHARCQQDQQRR